MQAQQGHELIFVLRQLRVDARNVDAVLVIVDEQVAGLKFTGVGKLIVGGQRTCADFREGGPVAEFGRRYGWKAARDEPDGRGRAAKAARASRQG